MKKLLVAIMLTSALFLGALAGSTGGVHAFSPPPNDSFNSATVVASIPYTDFPNTSDAGGGGNDPDIGACSSNSSGYGHSVWYDYTPPFSQEVDVDTIGSNFDTILAAFTGTKGNLSQVACNDDLPSGNQDRDSAIKLDLNGGTTYHFLVGSYDDTGGGSLHFHITPQDALYFDNFALKCYQTKIAKRSARFQPQTISTYDANFEFSAETTIQSPSLYCTPADVNEIGSTGAVGGNKRYASDVKSVCYTARDSQVFVKGGSPTTGARVFAQNELFGDQKLQLGRLESVCVLALKEHGQLPKLSPFDGQILRCYAARPVKGGPRPASVRVSIEDQFSIKGQPKVATLLRPVTYCTLGGKSNDPGCIVLDCDLGAQAGHTPEPEPTEVAVVCYSLRQPSFHPFDIPVIDQFLDQQFVDLFLTIKKADRLCLDSVKKPPFANNDEIKNAIPIGLTEGCLAGGNSDPDECRFFDHVVTLNATRPRSDPVMTHCASVSDHVDYGHSVWYSFTATDDFNHLDIDTEESSYDTIIAVYTGSKGGLTQFACDDDGAAGVLSDLEVDLQIGQKYFIMVGSKDRTPGGKLKFNIEGCHDSCDSN